MNEKKSLSQILRQAADLAVKNQAELEFGALADGRLISRPYTVFGLNLDGQSYALKIASVFPVDERRGETRRAAPKRASSTRGLDSREEKKPSIKQVIEEAVKAALKDAR
jgi:hypothetical protein